MKIDSYSFSEIFINGKKYTDDVIIFPDKIKSSWWRKEGHKLHLEDLTEVVEYKPDKLIIGTGKSGMMAVLDNLVNKLNKENIQVIVKRTDKAVDFYNKNRNKNTVAALHLTC